MNDKRFTGLSVIGLVGGIGSGKSAIARQVASRQRYFLIDADAIGHDVLREPSVKEAIQQRFGATVIDEQGRILRSELAKQVFGPSEASQTARKALNQIVHPPIGERIRQQIAQAKAQALREPGTVRGVLLDAAILLETGWADLCDAVVFIDTPEETRRHRVLETRGWDAAAWRQREASQFNLDVKRHAADFTVDNSGTLDSAVTQLEQFLSSRLLNAHSPSP